MRTAMISLSLSLPFSPAQSLNLSPLASVPPRTWSAALACSVRRVEAGEETRRCGECRVFKHLPPACWRLAKGSTLLSCCTYAAKNICRVLLLCWTTIFQADVCCLWKQGARHRHSSAPRGSDHSTRIIPTFCYVRPVANNKKKQKSHLSRALTPEDETTALTKGFRNC